MPLAARVGDMTSHGTSLGPGPGSPNVLIGGMPAWRATTDMHTCPLVSPGPVPHVGGMVSLGSTSVLINNLPAARQGDMIVESGPPNSIVMGCPTVQIG
ncbi:MAG: PAAR domain-containing protein [Candidatus Omnitrophica bacterium]|nr:PAAR domain-containing protein [Candidatus Omnitrophota bacterium]